MRKSSRQPVPNPIYQEGITELKKVKHIITQENTAKSKKKNRGVEENNYSYEYDGDTVQNQNINSSSGQSAPGTKFIVEGYNTRQEETLTHREAPHRETVHRERENLNKERERERERKREKEIALRERERERELTAQTPKPSNKAEQSNLLEAFIQAIVEVERTPLDVVEMPKAVPVKKVIRTEGEDFIKELTIEEKTMKIVHSQLKTGKNMLILVEIPIEWSQTKMEEENENESAEKKEIEEIQRKLENCKILKNISIFA